MEKNPFNWEHYFLEKNQDFSQEAICKVNIPFESTGKNTQADISMFYLDNPLQKFAEELDCLFYLLS